MKLQTLFVFLPAVAADFATVFPVFTDTCKQCLTKPYEACLPEKSATFVECICATQAQTFIQCMGGTTCDHGDDFSAATGWLTFCITNYKPVRDAYCQNSSSATLPIPANELTKQLCAASSGGSGGSGTATTTSCNCSAPVVTPTSAAPTTLKPVTTTKGSAPVTPTSTAKPPPVVVSRGVVSQTLGGLSVAVSGLVAALLCV